MKRERWRQVERLLEAVLELDENQRATFLLETCAADDGLRREVESLLEHEGRAEHFIEEPAPVLAAKALAEDTKDEVQSPVSEPAAPGMIGRMVSHYRILEKLGEGGMGAVYRAVRADDEYQKQVAIKLVKPDFDTEFILHRFRSERQILAGLEHANIAGLLDGGTTSDGLPYFVMELVEGEPIDRFCDSHKLPTAERLGLFRKICSAVQYAHQHLVIHRDLKPGNILVTSEGVPKLLDFGIAKIVKPDALSDGNEATKTMLRVMTPEYASPEQLRGETISTASDVYSLGVVLYYLLTGHLPYRLPSRSPYEIAQAVCEIEPERPSIAVGRVEKVPGRDGTRLTLTPELVSSTRDGPSDKLRRRLSGDLDYILLKALRKEPERRYASVEQFSEDVQRHLGGLPVIARQGTASYRCAKFAKRHRTGVIAAALGALALMAGMAAITREAHIARSERAKAERRFADVRQLAGSLVFELHDAIRDLPGSTAARELVLKRALQFLDSLARESQGDVGLQRELADAYRRVGDVQGLAGSANLGEPAAALESYHKALQLRQRVAAAGRFNVQARRELANAYGDVANVLAMMDHPNEAEANDHSALKIREAWAASEPANPDAQSDLATSYFQIGLHRSLKGDRGAALESYRKSLPLFQQVAGARPGNWADQRNVSLAGKRIGAILIVQGHLPEAREHYQAALAIDEARCAANPNDAAARLDLTFSYSDLALILWRSGDRASALANYRKVLAIREPLAAADPKNARAQTSLADTLARIGAILTETGDAEGAISPLQRALAIRQAIVAGDHLPPEFQVNLAVSYFSLAAAYEIRAQRYQGPVQERILRWRAARDLYRRGLPNFLERKAAGKLTGSDAEDLDSASRGLQRCNAAIARWGGLL